jgi:subtilisin family serine protease
MSKIDPRLKFLRKQTPEDLVYFEATGRFAVEAAEVPSPKITVLIQFTGDIEDIKEKGFETRTVAGNVASGLIELERLDDIASLDAVIKIESSRPLTSELDKSVPEIRADLVHSEPPGFKGSGVIVGIIDTGIHYPHECFRNEDGTSRILAIWDQYLTAVGTETPPAGYDYGVEYTKTEIDNALASADPSSVVRHYDHDLFGGHGTHVAGIAAGNGSAVGNGDPAFTYVGVAPEADIIVVANHIKTEALGDSVGTLDAVNYIFEKAASLGKPVVINQSQGDNLGSHDGTSLLELGFDNLIVGAGKSFVKSAGNAANDDIHAHGSVSAGGTEEVQFVVPVDDKDPDTIDIWYSGQDQLGISIKDPGGHVSPVVNPGTDVSLNLANGNSVFIDSVLHDPVNNDNRIYIQLERGTQPAIEQGTWCFSLSGITVTDGHFHAWIERGDPIPHFIGPHLDNTCTISIPGTSNKVITVASYRTSGLNIGDISNFSSIGPTRDGREKPEIAAPGQRIKSAKSRGSGDDQYRLKSGTSMAAPHVAGAIALMLQQDGSLTQTQIKDRLTTTARSDAFTGPIPNNTWGYGKLDSKGAFNNAPWQHTLTLNTAGNGSVSKVPDQAAYLHGDVVQLNATADPRWTFKNWSGDLTGSANPVNITMDDDKVVDATFERTPCFVAMVTLGSMIIPHVQFLRVYRDEVILKSVLKNLFEQLLDRYYQFSPYVVRKMDESTIYERFVKYILVYPFIFLAKRAVLTAQVFRARMDVAKLHVF